MKTEPKNPDDFYKQKLTLLNLKAGDILTFEGEENDLISSLIMKLTNSKVTHGALRTVPSRPLPTREPPACTPMKSQTRKNPDAPMSAASRSPGTARSSPTPKSCP